MASQMMYFEQWLKTATDGKISCTFAFAADRMMLVCHTCQASYTAQTPEGTTVDFGVQQFVELHLHKGGYTKPTGDMVWDKDMKLVPLTADFKGVDCKPEMAKKIFDATLASKQEYAAKLNDASFAEKLVALQQADSGKTKFTELPTATDDELYEVEKAAAALKAIENALKIKQLKSKMRDIQNGFPPVESTPAPNSGGEILKIATGRKFR